VIKGDRQGECVTPRWARVSVGHIIVGNIFSMVVVQCQDVVVPPLVLVHAKRESATAVNFSTHVYWPFN